MPLFRQVFSWPLPRQHPIWCPCIIHIICSKYTSQYHNFLWERCEENLKYCLCHVNPLSVRLFNHTWDAHILWIRCSCGFGYEINGDDRYTTPLKQGDVLFDKRYHSSHPLFTVTHNVVSYFCLLLYSGSHYRCQPE